MLFPWETFPFEVQGVAGRTLNKEGKSAAPQVIYHMRHLSSSAMSLANSLYRHCYQRTDPKTTCFPHVDELQGYFLWLHGQAGIPGTPNSMQLSLTQILLGDHKATSSVLQVEEEKGTLKKS